MKSFDDMSMSTIPQNEVKLEAFTFSNCSLVDMTLVIEATSIDLIAYISVFIKSMYMFSINEMETSRIVSSIEIISWTLFCIITKLGSVTVFS
jgi:hypothetical protein